MDGVFGGVYVDDYWFECCFCFFVWFFDWLDWVLFVIDSRFIFDCLYFVVEVCFGEFIDFLGVIVV